jgi:putative peptide zinc metalloprotease protein
MRSAPGRGRRHRRSWGAVAVPAAASLVVVQVARASLRLPAVATEARLVHAAAAARNPAGIAPAGVGLDGLAARAQLSAYAGFTGAFERYPTPLAGARELGLLACAALLAAVVALARSLSVRPLAAAVGFGAVAACPPAVTTLATFGPGLLGAAWLAVGAAVLARTRTWLRVLGVPAVLGSIVSAPVLAVLVLVVSAAVLVAVRVRRGAALLGVAVLGAALPLALLPPPGGAAALPAVVAAAMLVGLVVVDEAVARLGRRWRRVRHRDPR